MLSRSALREEARGFWSTAGDPSRWGTPPDLVRALHRSRLRLAVEPVDGLRVATVSARLRAIGAPPWSDPCDRPLRACLVADQGAGLVLVDRGDAPDEQRFSVAHEVAHFLVHYLRPRREALAHFGEPIRDVLDRRRPPTSAERFSAALRDVPLAPYHHAMERPGRTRDPRTRAMEAEADDLALEILAPWEEVSALTGDVERALVERYGLPAAPARWLACQIPRDPSVSGVLRLFAKK